MSTTFCFKVCLDILVNYYAGFLNGTKIDGVISYLDYFNIDKVPNDQEGICALNHSASILSKLRDKNK